MVEGRPISIGNVAYVLGMSSKKLQRWYQMVLSGFKQALEGGEISKDNLKVKRNGEEEEIVVPISEEKNLVSSQVYYDVIICIFVRNTK